MAGAGAGRRRGAPNVLLVVLDDVGFAQLGCFGSDIDTPTFDRLAAGGLRYANFHTTGAVLAHPGLPADRAATTTRWAWAASSSWPPASPATTPASRRRAGCCPRPCVPRAATPPAPSASGTSPPRTSSTPGRRRDRWPLGRGFERFYGFFDGETHQFGPALVHDNHLVEPPRAYEDGYHLTEDLVDHAIDYVEDLRYVDPDKPCFVYFCPGACHSPHQAPRRLDRALPRPLRRGLGRLAGGGPRAPEGRWASCPAHTVLSAAPGLGAGLGGPRPTTSSGVYARYMEAFAGYLSHTDDQVGRLVDALADDRASSTTRSSCVLSDNGASSEGGPVGSLNDARPWNVLPRTVEEAPARIDEIGGPDIHNNYPWGWTVAGNTPVPALEARDARGRRGRPADRPLARRHRRRAARSATSTCTPSTSRRPCSTCSASSRPP